MDADIGVLVRDEGDRDGLRQNVRPRMTWCPSCSHCRRWLKAGPLARHVSRPPSKYAVARILDGHQCGGSPHPCHGRLRPGSGQVRPRRARADRTAAQGTFNGARPCGSRDATSTERMYCPAADGPHPMASRTSNTSQRPTPTRRLAVLEPTAYTLHARARRVHWPDPAEDAKESHLKGAMRLDGPSP